MPVVATCHLGRKIAAHAGAFSEVVLKSNLREQFQEGVQILNLQIDGWKIYQKLSNSCDNIPIGELCAKNTSAAALWSRKP